MYPSEPLFGSPEVDLAVGITADMQSVGMTDPGTPDQPPAAGDNDDETAPKRKPRKDPNAFTELDGIPPSSELRAQYAGQKMLVSFSRGKDSLVALLALVEAGVEVFPYHLSHIPGMPLVQEGLAYYREKLGLEIIDLPHPTFWRWMRQCSFQPPERWTTIQSWGLLDMPPVDYSHINTMVCEHYGLDPKVTLTAVGVRAADSPFRKLAIRQTGPVNLKRMQIQAVWDWRAVHIKEILRRTGVALPDDYRLFNRSFDGTDHRFVEPLSRLRPEDWAYVQRWFPMARMELLRGTF